MKMDVDANRTVGRVLQGLRDATGQTQGALASKMGKPQSFVSKVESGERNLRAYELFMYSKALGISPYEVLSTLEQALEHGHPETEYVLVRLSY